MVGVSDLNHLMDEDSFFSYVSDGQTFNTKGGRGVRSTASINGGKQYFATSHAVSDILQGALLNANPQDDLLVINRALTNQLKGLPDEITSYSSFTNTIPQVSIGSGGGGGVVVGANPGFGNDGALDPAWVKALPLIHPDGQIIWSGQGRASSEMHLPTSNNISEDIAQHRQSPSLPTNERHPWNMDRAGGPIGGEGGYNTDPSQGPTILKGESSGSAGSPGAFGILDAESEQWYISMAWPMFSPGFSGVQDSFTKAGRPDLVEASKKIPKTSYPGKRLLVYCAKTGRGVVTTPGDWGTQPYWSNGAVGRNSINGFYYGLSPDVHDALGTKHGDDMTVRWMPDTAPLGPYQPTAEQAASSGAYQGTSNSASGSKIINSLEELVYAGKMISKHPGMAQTQHKDRLVDGFHLQSSATPARPSIWFPSINRGFLYPSLLNYLWYLLEAGYSFSGSVAGYYNKYSNSGKISNHSYGGAIDIMGIGAPGHSPVKAGNSQWMAFCESAFNYLATLPRETKPAEIGGDFDRKFGDWLKVYRDAGHIHFGFDQTQIGQLIPALKVRSSTNTAINGFN
jgi:hypothetical protein